MTATHLFTRCRATVLMPITALAILIFSSSLNDAGGKVEYLRIRGAVLFSKPGLKVSDARDTLELGSALEIVETKGSWSKVKTQPVEKDKKSTEGWLPSSWLSSKPPVLETKAGAQSAITTQAAAKLQAYSSLRGIDPQKSKALLERFSTTPDLNAFHQEGKLGLYRDDEAYPLEGVAK